MPNIVHVVGTGTIGEPLIGLLADHAADFGIDEVTFHKRTPMIEERAKVRDLVGRGAVLAVDDDRRASFEEIGHTPKLGTVEAIERGCGRHRLHPGRQRQQGGVLREGAGTPRLSRPGVGIRIRQDVCPRDQR